MMDITIATDRPVHEELAMAGLPSVRAAVVSAPGAGRVVVAGGCPGRGRRLRPDDHAGPHPLRASTITRSPAASPSVITRRSPLFRPDGDAAHLHTCRRGHDGHALHACCLRDRARRHHQAHPGAPGAPCGCARTGRRTIRSGFGNRPRRGSSGGRIGTRLDRPSRPACGCTDRPRAPAGSSFRVVSPAAAAVRRPPGRARGTGARAGSPHAMGSIWEMVLSGCWRLRAHEVATEMAEMPANPVGRRGDPRGRTGSPAPAGALPGPPRRNPVRAVRRRGRCRAPAAHRPLRHQGPIHARRRCAPWPGPPRLPEPAAGLTRCGRERLRIDD